MPLRIIREDITRFPCDAIVNAAKESLLGGGGVDGAIHRAAGPDLLRECRTLGGCPTGQSKITKGYRLPCKYVIHTVGPVWRGGGYGEKALLESCYRTAMRLAAEYGCETVAFPLISSGIFGYPKDQALRVASDTIAAFLADCDREMTVYLLVHDRAGYRIASRLYDGVKSYIDDSYVDEHGGNRRDRHGEEHGGRAREQSRRANILERIQPSFMGLRRADAGPGRAEAASFMPDRADRGGVAPVKEDRAEAAPFMLNRAEAASAMEDRAALSPSEEQEESAPAGTPSLDEMLNQMDESFSQMLLRKIDERGMTDAQCYKKANIDRKLFSKIRSNVNYKPSKPTAAAFAVALELSLAEARDLLRKAGYALSHSSKFDIIIEYFLLTENYNIFEINETLFAFDQRLLGA